VHVCVCVCVCVCNLITRQLAYMFFIKHCVIVEIMRINRLFNIICHLHPSNQPSIYLSVYLSLYLPAYLLTCLSVCLSLYPPTHPSSHPSILQSIHLFIICVLIFPTLHPSNSLSDHLFMHPSTYLSVPLCIKIAVCSRFYICLCV